MKMGSYRFCKKRVRSEISHDSCRKIDSKIEKKLSLKSKNFFFFYIFKIQKVDNAHILRNHFLITTFENNLSFTLSLQFSAFGYLVTCFCIYISIYIYPNIDTDVFV